VALARGELSDCAERAREPFLDEAHAEKIRRWHEDRDIVAAAELVVGAVVTGVRDSLEDAARMVMAADVPQLTTLKMLAARVMAAEGIEVDPTDGEPFSDLTKQDAVQSLRRRARALKARLRRDPRNALAWTDLAFMFETLGQRLKADRAMRAAMATAPHNRHVLRSAVRLRVHHDELEHAFDVLKRTPATRSDPWLMAADVAVASAMAKPPHFIGVARDMLRSRNLPPFHTSELASAIGTLELYDGRLTRARRFLKDSLVDPTENSLAQASWLTRESSQLQLESAPDPLSISSAEGRAWVFKRNGRWSDSVRAATTWLIEQPFSSRPAIFGSYVAATAEGDLARTEAFARLGLVANPGNFTLLNNLAYARAKLGFASEASAILRKVDRARLTARENAVCRATEGLVAFRTGDPERGSALYVNALELITNLRDGKLRALALLNFAIESVRADALGAMTLRREAIEAAESLRDEELAKLTDELRHADRVTAR